MSCFRSFRSCGFIRSLTLPLNEPEKNKSKFDQGFGRGSENRRSVPRYSHHIFDPDPELAGQVNSRLDCDHHAGLQPGLLPGADAWRLVNLHADPVPGGVGKLLGQSRLAQHAAGRLIDVPADYPGAYGGDCGLLRLEHRFVRRALFVPRFAEVDGTGHIRAITLVDYTEVEGEEASAGQL